MPFALAKDAYEAMSPWQPEVHGLYVLAATPWSSGCYGTTVREHGYVGNGFVHQVMTMLQHQRGWHKLPVVWDTTLDSDGLSALDCICITVPKDTWATPEAVRYLVNHDKRQYIDMDKLCPAGNGRTVHPLPVLVTDGGDDGIHDGEDPLQQQGAWHGDRLSTGPTRPSDEEDGPFVEVEFAFRQDSCYAPRLYHAVQFDAPAAAVRHLLDSGVDAFEEYQGKMAVDVGKPDTESVRVVRQHMAGKQVLQLLVGARVGGSASSLVRLAQHSLFEANVFREVRALLT